MPRSSATALLLHRQMIGIAKSEVAVERITLRDGEVERPATAQRVGSPGQRFAHHKVAVADRHTSSTGEVGKGAKDPRCRRSEPELRGSESEGAEVHDRLAVDRAEEGTHDDVVREGVRTIALLCC